MCGGTGIALISAGPAGILAGLVIGALASLLGWPAISAMMNRARIPVALRRVNIEKKLRSNSVQNELRTSLLSEISRPESEFQKQVVQGFSQAFRQYVYSIAQAAEIPIE